MTVWLPLPNSILNFTVEESAASVHPAGSETSAFYEMLETITQGKGEMEDLEKLRNLVM
jgi:NADH:ubiquinone oxidoreductase subunit F (NADH-binding)